jgi:peroxiredoxin
MSLVIPLETARFLPALRPAGHRWPGAAARLVFPLLLLLVAACGGDRAAGQAPDFQVTRFDGGEFQLSARAGRSPVVLNFWYPTCPPCRAEMPALEKAWQQLRDEEVQFLGMFVPQGFDSEQDAKDFIEELGLTYAFATDKGGRIARSYELEYFPTTLFVDRSGRIFKRHVATLGEEGIVRIVREMAQN